MNNFNVDKTNFSEKKQAKVVSNKKNNHGFDKNYLTREIHFNKKN